MLSKNGVGIILLILSLLGVNVTEGEVITTVSVIGQIVSALLMAYNQYKREDITNFIFKK